MAAIDDVDNDDDHYGDRYDNHDTKEEEEEEENTAENSCASMEAISGYLRITASFLVSKLRPMALHMPATHLGTPPCNTQTQQGQGLWKGTIRISRLAL